jgi:hypothetical protein
MAVGVHILVCAREKLVPPCLQLNTLSTNYVTKARDNATTLRKHSISVLHAIRKIS